MGPDKRTFWSGSENRKKGEPQNAFQAAHPVTVSVSGSDTLKVAGEFPNSQVVTDPHSFDIVSRPEK